MARVFGCGNLDSRVIVFLGLLFAGTHAQEVPADILKELSSERFSNREAAERKLKDWARLKPALSLSALHRESVNADDPEVQVRCRAVLKALVLEKEFTGEGYLGISMFEMTAQIPGEQMPRRAIRIGMVMPGTAADDAGLVPNDLIIGLNDQIWRQDGMSTEFAKRIRETKPGSDVTLVMLQGEKIARVKLKVGLKPIEPGEEGAANAQAAQDRFFEKWLNKHEQAER